MAVRAGLAAGQRDRRMTGHVEELRQPQHEVADRLVGAARPAPCSRRLAARESAASAGPARRAPPAPRRPRGAARSRPRAPARNPPPARSVPFRAAAARSACSAPASRRASRRDRRRRRRSRMCRYTAGDVRGVRDLDVVDRARRRRAAASSASSNRARTSSSSRSQKYGRGTAERRPSIGSGASGFAAVRRPHRAARDTRARRR